MFGWIVIFTVMLLWGTAAAAMGGGAGSPSGIASSLVFGFLLVVSALTFALRGRV